MGLQDAGSVQAVSKIRVGRGRTTGAFGSGLVLVGIAMVMLTGTVLGATASAIHAPADRSADRVAPVPAVDSKSSPAMALVGAGTDPRGTSDLPSLTSAASIPAPATAPESTVGATGHPLSQVEQSYELRVHLRTKSGLVDTVETVSITNRSDTTVDHLDLSVIPRALGIFELTGPVLVDGRSVDPTWTTTTNLRVPTGDGLAPGETTTVVVTFRLHPGRARGIFAARLAFQHGILDLGEWFPILSREHDAYGIGDPQVSYDAASMTLDLSTDHALPRDAVAAAGVRTVAPRRSGRHWVFRATHVRDFALAVAPAFRVTTGRVGLTMIRVYSTHRNGATTIAIARAALRFYNARYGRYPYPGLTIAETAAPGFSMEFPTIVLMAADRMISPSTVAHEIAHQWFYGLLGNDQLTDPWVDEAFAQFSAHAFTHEADRTCSNRPVDLGIDDWTGGLTSGRWFDCSGLAERPDGHGSVAVTRVRPFRACPAGDVTCGGYYETIYLKGAVLVDRIRRAMGDRAFFGAVRQLIADHRYGIVTTADVLRFLVARAPDKLTGLVSGYVSPELAASLRQ